MAEMHVFDTKNGHAQQAGIIFEQIFDPPKKLKRVNRLREERKVVA